MRLKSWLIFEKCWYNELNKNQKNRLKNKNVDISSHEASL
jgi:hypothetical protein